jgi:hypothetical protein
MAGTAAAPRTDAQPAGSTLALITLNPQDLLARAVDKGATVETLERLMALAKDMKAIRAKEAWHEAMAEFQRTCPPITKTKKADIQTTRGSYSYRYAPLDEIMEVVRPIMGGLGLSVCWSSRIEANGVAVNCRISHVLGHSEDSGEVRMPIAGAEERGGGNPAQRVGSALSYAKRYSFLSSSGLTPEDDDDAQGTTSGDSAQGGQGEGGPRAKSGPVFPFGKHKGEPPSALDVTDLHKELAFWQTKTAEEENDRYKAGNQRLVDAIQEAIAEKTAKPETSTGSAETGKKNLIHRHPEDEKTAAPAAAGPSTLDLLGIRDKLWLDIKALAGPRGYDKKKLIAYVRTTHKVGPQELGLEQVRALKMFLAGEPVTDQAAEEARLVEVAKTEPPEDTLP